MLVKGAQENDEEQVANVYNTYTRVKTIRAPLNKYPVTDITQEMTDIFMYENNLLKLCW